MSLLWRHILSAWLLSSDFFSLGGVCQAGWVGVKTSKTLSFNESDTSQIRWLCLCLSEDFHVFFFFREVFESDVCYLLVRLIIKCGFQSLCTASSPAQPPDRPIQHLESCNRGTYRPNYINATAWLCQLSVCCSMHINRTLFGYLAAWMDAVFWCSQSNHNAVTTALHQSRRSHWATQLPATQEPQTELPPALASLLQSPFYRAYKHLVLHFLLSERTNIHQVKRALLASVCSWAGTMLITIWFDLHCKS